MLTYHYLNLFVISFLSSSIFGQIPSCRLSSQDIWVPEDFFSSFACGECFYYTFLQNNKYYESSYYIERCPGGVLICSYEYLKANFDLCNCQSIENIYNLYEFNNNSQPLETVPLEPPLPFGYITMTADCCNAARKCCEEMTKQAVSEAGKDSVTSCPSTWDGWQCWPDSASGAVIRGTCPYYTYTWTLTSESLNSVEYYSVKECTSDGIWWRNNATNLEWTDYRNCATSSLHDEFVKYVLGIASFSLSLLAIIPTLIIFNAYSSLKVDRIKIHKHLLLSFLLMGIFYIFNNAFFVADIAHGVPLVEANHISCRILFTIQLRYLRVCNYMWMFCEGVYLFKLLIDAFAESRSLLIYYLLGWVFPVLPTAVYSALRAELDDDKCWIVPNIDWIEWITYGPCIISLILNLGLMLIILRILITKLRDSPDNELVQFRKAVRAILVLLPLFGLHFFLTIYRLKHILAYELINKLLDGLQGFFVALVICYTNNEVLDLIKNSWKSCRNRRSLKREMIMSQKSFQMEQNVLL